MKVKFGNRIVATNSESISAMFAENKNPTVFLMFEYILLPSLTATIMVAKLSSVTIMSATSFVTSVPVIPIPTPISAVFKLGASLTPSPVIATILPISLKVFTILTLFSGLTLAYTFILFITFLYSSSLNLSSSVPNITCFSFSQIPNCLATLNAVFLWSPVIIIGVIFACLQTFTASKTSRLGGSIIPTSPTNIKSFSS